MGLDLAAIIRQLEAVEARHPDTAPELGPIVRALNGGGDATIGTERARRILGVRSVNTVKRWIEAGILAGEWDERSGRWRIPLADVLRVRAAHAVLSGIGGEDLSPEELDALSATRPGTLPWRRGEPS